MHDHDADLSPLEERLARYVDGELGEAERAAFERELAEDGELRAEADELREVHALGRAEAEPPPVSADEWASVYAGIERRTRKSARIVALRLSEEATGGARAGFRLRLLAIAAGVLLATLAGLPLLVSHDREEARDPFRFARAEPLEFDDSPGANAFRVLEMSSSRGYSPTIILPASADDPTFIMLDADEPGAL